MSLLALYFHLARLLLIPALQGALAPAFTSPLPQGPRWASPAQQKPRALGTGWPQRPQLLPKLLPTGRYLVPCPSSEGHQVLPTGPPG